MDQRWMIHPSKTNQRIAARQNWTIAIAKSALKQLPQAGDEETAECGENVPR